MESSHINTLQELVDEIIEWIRKPRRFRWNPSQDKNGGKTSVSEVSILSCLEVVCDHVPILGIDLFMKRKRMSLPIPYDCYSNLRLSVDWKDRFQTRNFQRVNEWVVSFLQDLREVFEVPKLNYPRNVVVTSFMDFLLQLLLGNAHLFTSEGNLVINELQSFTTIFLDSPFQPIGEDGQVQVHTLLSQFETLADEVASFVHSFLFSLHPAPFKKMDELLLEPITLLKANINQYLNSTSYMNTPNPLHSSVSSVFIVNSFLYDLENLMNREDDLIVEVKDYAEKLYKSLKHSWSLLNKHSDRTNELKEVVSLAFDAEYLINYFLCGDAPAWYLALRLPHIIHNVELVGARLQGMVWENHDVDQVFKVGVASDARRSLQSGINAGVDDTMVGFKDEELKILGELVGGGEGRQIISIIGMPGLGKTTLAKKMYNHPTVRDKFERISWCIVSQTYKKKELLVDILMGLDSEVDKAKIAEEEEDDVGVRIHKTLIGRRYFIVVDDIWELSAWEAIKRYFPDTGNGSRILFTSRNKEVADQCNSTTHSLPLLSTDQCWELLEKKVFCGEACPPELQDIGERIATKCNGLPLVVVAVAGILSTRKDISVWEDVERSLNSYILSSKDRAVGKSLELSYMYLPHHLKPCFLYFVRFQEDEKIRVEPLMQLWIAEGFIPADEKKRAEDTAKEYLKELIDKSLVMVAKTNLDGQAKVCALHDLLRDMCLKIAGEDNFLKRVNGDYSHKLHRAICTPSYTHLHPHGRWIRSFMCHKVSSNSISSLNVSHMKALRGLDAQGVRHLLGIENLVHVRYLTLYSQLPEPIRSFSSLEFLIVHDRFHISSSLLDIVPKLRYLSAQDVVLDDCDTTRTYNLEYISELVISNEDVKQWWKVFPRLRKLRCHNASSSGRYDSDWSSLTQLESLSLKGSTITAIKLPPSIRRLKLSGRRGTPHLWEKWSDLGKLPNLEILKLRRLVVPGGEWETRDDEFRKLKYLRLISVKNLVEWNVSSWEHFPLLQHLIVYFCDGLYEGIPTAIADIPTLQSISVEDCFWLRDSVREIEEQLKSDGNEDVRIVFDDPEYHPGNDIEHFGSCSIM